MIRKYRQDSRNFKLRHVVSMSYDMSQSNGSDVKTCLKNRGFTVLLNSKFAQNNTK